MFLLASSLFMTLMGKTATDSDAKRQALYDAINQAGEAIKSAPFGSRTVAILPLPGSNDPQMISRLKNVVTKAGFKCVEGKEDAMWNEIVKEIAWDERKSDILDDSTLVKFGKLKAAQILLQYKVIALDQNSDRVYAEIELHATDIATKRHIWGDNFVSRFYLGKDIEGIIKLDSDLRMLLQKNFEVAYQSLTSPEFAGKLNDVKTVTVVPLSGDIDQYLTSLATGVLTRTRHMPKLPQIQTLSRVRAFARDGKLDSDAIFYGALRDLSRTQQDSYPSEDCKRVKIEYKLETDIQLFMEDAKTGAVLWSKTITVPEVIYSERQCTESEFKYYRSLQQRDRKIKADDRDQRFNEISGEVKEDIADNWRTYILYILAGIAGLAVLILLLCSFKVIVSFFTIR